jgi:hypothetical protein
METIHKVVSRDLANDKIVEDVSEECLRDLVHEEKAYEEQKAAPWAAMTGAPAEESPLDPVSRIRWAVDKECVHLLEWTREQAARR